MSFTVNTGEAAASTGTGTTATATVTAPTQGNLLFAIVTLTAGGVMTASGTWNKLNETTNASGNRSAVFYKVAGAGESTSQAICTWGVSSGWAISYCTASGNHQSAPLDVSGANNDNLSPITLTAAVNPVDSVERLLVGAAAIDTRTGTFSTEKFNGSTTGVTQLITSAHATNAIKNDLFSAIDTNTAAGNYTSEAAATGLTAGTIFLAIFAPAPPVSLIRRRRPYRIWTIYR